MSIISFLPQAKTVRLRKKVTCQPPNWALFKRALASLFLLIGVVAARIAYGSAPEPLPTKRGDFAFHYAARYSPEEMRWYSKFNIVVTGGLLPSEQVQELRAAGCKLLFYEWLVAFYEPGANPENSWERTVLEKHPAWLLNPTKGLYGHAGAKETAAYYFDPAPDGLRASRVRHIIEKAQQHGYAGVFFDTTGFGSVHPDAQQIFKERYPKAEYDFYVGRFLSQLKREAHDLVIFTNQGYRNHTYYLPYADYDLTESYMTAAAGPAQEVYVEGRGLQTVTETYVHPWYKPENVWDSVSHYCRVLINDPIRAQGYRTRIYHLNYGQPRYERTEESAEKGGKRHPIYRETLDREALYYGVAAALLMGQSSYYEAGPGIPADDVYFIDMGKPLSGDNLYDQRLRVAWRVFANGIVAVNDSQREAVLPIGATLIPRGVVGLWDVFEQKEAPDFVKTGRLRIPASRYEATQRWAPAGRIYVFLRGKKQQ